MVIDILMMIQSPPLRREMLWILSLTAINTGIFPRLSKKNDAFWGHPDRAPSGSSSVSPYQLLQIISVYYYAVLDDLRAVSDIYGLYSYGVMQWKP